MLDLISALRNKYAFLNLYLATSDRSQAPNPLTTLLHL